MPKSSSRIAWMTDLQVVALLAAHPELLALDLALHALEAERLDELVDVRGLVPGDAGHEGDVLADRAAGGLLHLAVVERLERHLAPHELLLEHLAQRLQAVLADAVRA